MKRRFEPRRWIINGILPEGCCILAAHPKTGKSWLALQLCKSITTGEEMFGRSVIKGKALYLALEDDDLRLQSRLRKLNIEATGNVNMLAYETDWCRDGQGGVEDIEVWLKENSDAKLEVDGIGWTETGRT